MGSGPGQGISYAQFAIGHLAGATASEVRPLSRRRQTSVSEAPSPQVKAANHGSYDSKEPVC
jgi:hypothetical protein